MNARIEEHLMMEKKLEELKMFIKKIVSFVGAVILVLGFSVSANAAGHAKKADHEVKIKGMAFSPKNITVKAGETILFINMDAAPHTATAKDGSFGTGRLKKGESSMVKVSSAGDISYICKIHPSMKGSISAK